MNDEPAVLRLIPRPGESTAPTPDEPPPESATPTDPSRPVAEEPSAEDLSCPHCSRNVGGRAYAAARRHLESGFQAREEVRIHRLATEHAALVEQLTAEHAASRASLIADATQEALRQIEARQTPEKQRAELVAAIRAHDEGLRVADDVMALRKGEAVGNRTSRARTPAERIVDPDYPLWRLTLEERQLLIQARGRDWFIDTLRRQACGRRARIR